MLVAANMRPVATSIGPLVHQISSGLRLSGAVAGLLLTIPVLCFGAIAPLAPLLSRRLGIARSVALILSAIIAGLVLRVSGGVLMLFAGTTIAAAGAACGQCPACRSWSGAVSPTASGKMSSLYSTALVGMAALAAGATVPLAHLVGHGWRGGLAVWAAPAIVALLIWLPQLRHEPVQPAHAVRPARVRELTRGSGDMAAHTVLRRSVLGFYATIRLAAEHLRKPRHRQHLGGPAARIERCHGGSRRAAGPRLAARWRDQGALAAALTAVTAIGYAGLLLAPSKRAGSVGAGARHRPGRVLPARADDDRAAQRLGAPDRRPFDARAVRRLPTRRGRPADDRALHDATGSWTLSLIVLIFVLVPQATTGVGAGRNRIVRARTATAHD